jgi:maltooligosyltrehalose trehalohydrolase
MQACLPDPIDPQTFVDSKLDLSERQHHAEIYVLHRDLLRLRQTDAVFRSQRSGGLDGAVLGPEAFVLRFFGAHSDDRLLVVNLGSDLHLAPAPEPLLAPPEDMDWIILWSSEDPRYGGDGVIPLEDEGNWYVPGHTATVLRPHTRQGQEG